jgi:hypothetical protein
MPKVEASSTENVTYLGENITATEINTLSAIRMPMPNGTSSTNYSHRRRGNLDWSRIRKQDF